MATTDTNGGEEQPNELDAEGFLDDDSEDEDFVVTIGEIKSNVPFNVPVKSSGQVSKIELDVNPTYKGQSIYDVDLAELDEKPWRKPGADITDYFNYGFNEETWNLYCDRQRKLRQEYGNNQTAINRSIMMTMQPVTANSGRQLVNIIGSDQPTSQPKVIVDLSKPPPSFDNLTESSKLLFNAVPVSSVASATSNVSIPTGPPKSSPMMPDFSRPPPSIAELSGSAPPSSSVETPPGVEDLPPGSTPPPGTDLNQRIPTVGNISGLDVSVPGFNPNVPPPGLSGMPISTITSMPPPNFNQPQSGYAGFGSNFGQTIANMVGGTPYGRRGDSRRYDDDRRRRDRSHDESDDDYRRRKTRRYSRSRSPSSRRHRDDSDRYRSRRKDSPKVEKAVVISSPSCSKKEDSREKDKKRARDDRDDDREREKKRKKHGRDDEDRREKKRSQREKDSAERVPGEDEGNQEERPPGV